MLSLMEFSLDGIWEMREIGEEEWLTATVPGSVMNDLLTLGKIADPFYRDNEIEAYRIAEKSYEYKRSFTLTEEFLQQDQIILLSEGLDTFATIYINDNEIARTNNMHRTYEMDVKEVLLQGENSIKVQFASPVKFIEERQKKQPLVGVEHAIPGYPYARKAHSMFGWDWGPKIPDFGIWRSITLVGRNIGYLDDVYITQQHFENHVDVNVRVQIERLLEGDIELEITVTSPDGHISTQNVKKAMNEENFPFLIEEPKLWWPKGYGNQPLYDIQITATAAGKIVDHKKYQIGLRTIEVKHEADQWGKSFEFSVNGISLFAKGANYIPEDSLIPRTSRQRTERLIQDCVEANFNMIRIWGGGYYPPDYFYELCDQYGLIVWQDFMFACSAYDVTKGFAETVKQEVIDNVKRIRHHASLGIWCGNNEVEEGWEYWGWPERSKFRTDYIKLFEVMLPELMENLDPETFYWPSSPSSGGGFDQPRNPDVGDMHYWNVWHGRKPFTEYRKYHFRFCSEFGFQSFPSIKTIETFTEEEDRNIFSYVMEKHQKNDGANGLILSYLSENFLYPKDFPSLLYVSQIQQAEAIKYGVEHWRRNRGRCMGSLYWQLNDCWPVASWSSIDYEGRWKALHYFAKKFYDPILLSIQEEGTEADIYVTNDTLGSKTVKVEWKLKTNRSRILKEGTTVQEIPSLTAQKLEALSFADQLTLAEKRRVYLEALLYIDGELYSTTTVLFTKAKHFEFLDPQIHHQVKETDDTFEIELSSACFAKYVELDLDGADCIFNENYFDLSADRSKKIVVKKESLSQKLSSRTFQDRLIVRSIYNIAN